MKTAKRMTSFLLLLSMLLSASACSNAETEENTDPSQTDSTAVNAEDAAEAEPEVDELADDLPETDLEGYNFRIASWLESQIPSVYADSMTGNPVSDAVFEKVATVEDRFNCDVTMVDYGNVTSNGEGLYVRAIKAGDDTFDIAGGHDITTANLTLEGYALNLYDVPHLDFSKPWWPAQAVNNLTLDGAMYVISNDISYYQMSETRVWYFNKEKFTELGLAYPYETVYEGKWTLDAMNELMKDSYRDLNGNGMVDADDDFFGVVNGGYYMFLEPFNIEPYRHTEDGGLEYYFDVERYSTIIEQFAKLLYGTSGMRFDGGGPAATVFADGRALMMYQTVAYAMSSLCQSDIVYGILPMPKFDETQDQYYGGCGDRPFIVPITAVGHLDQTGLIIEAMSAEGRRKVFPAYFEVALKSRYADQADDAKMFDIIMGNNILAFTYMYGNFKSAYNTLLSTMFGKDTPNTDVASWAASQEKSQTKYVEKLLKSFRSIREKQQKAYGEQ